MTIEDFLKIVWETRQTNPYLFYGGVIVIIFLIFLAYKAFKKRRKNAKIKENAKIEAERLIKLEADRKAKQYADKLALEHKQNLQKEITLKEQTKLKVQTENLKREADKKASTEIKSPTEDVKKILEEKKEAKSDIPKRQTVTPYIDTNEVQVKIIKSVPEPGSSTAKRIGYLPSDKYVQTEPYKYAVVKMPQKNSLIKFPRKGRSDKKGFKEDDFLIHLNRHFKSTFSVFNDRHIPTENGRPYEPDFVLSSEKDNKNIFINIEIDEPYDGWLRTPTHCIGENDLRDDFFTKRGWIVIRFAEIQIHCEPKKCCAYIAKVIHSIDSTFNSDLLNEVIPNQVEQWDNLQSKKWASDKFREKYLGIENFGKRPNVITEYEIVESTADKEVEKEMPKVKDKTISDNGLLASKNIDNRDKRIKFDPTEHRYFIDGNPDTISVTQLIDKFFPEFDAPYWGPIKAAQRGISTKEILAEWEAKRIDSANKGTALHEAIENYYNNKSHNSSTKEFSHFLSFKQRFNGMTPYRSEWRIFDEDLMVAGTIDMVYKKEDGSLYMFDWKRSEKVVNNDGTIKNDTFQFAFGELSHLGDNSYNRYCLQQNIYKAILEKRYKHKISSMNLLVMHEAYDRYHHIKIPNMDKEINYIFNYALLTR
ncbi:MAG: PD-(D/E)XK nuclease family protein [Bacteroidia bacterium]|nr:PD-(D/E)XK nuclease family protein [Bacteroidia bacterium]